MKRLASFAALFFFGCALLPTPVSADASHARIVRLSLVQGDISYTRQFHKDAMDDSKAVWEPAPLNLPIREGYALSTDTNARAEIEFENGAMAFLSGNTVIEFYDLSLDDGALITRLILRQGSAIFYVHPAKGDFFSVTGGDFSVEATNRSRFRLDNYDDGSTVTVEQGEIALLRKNETKTLEKGQSYSVNINDAKNPILARSPDYDDFDKWVSGRIDTVVTATTYANQYVNSPSYTAGFADLYDYGGWYNVPGYGFGWQPYGVGLGWSPFALGSWNYDPFLGWNFIGTAPWGWLPYHYGGWIFNPGMGWLWMPTGFGFGGPLPYRPVTGIWVRSGGTTGLVPLHPGDTHSRTPLNLAQGIYTVHGNTLAATTLAPSAGEKWAVVNRPARETFTAIAAEPVAAPTRVSRTILSSSAGSRTVTLSRDSSIVYDPAQHRFVNSSDPAKTSVEAVKNESKEAARGAAEVPENRSASAKPSVPAAPRVNAPRPSIAPPEPPASAHSSHSAAAGMWDAPSGTNSGSSASSSHTSTGSTGHSSGGHH